MKKNKKILTVCALVLLGAIVLPSSGYAGGGQKLAQQLTGEFPKICRIFGRNPVAVMPGKHRKPLNCTGTMLSRKHVLTTVGALPWHIYNMVEMEAGRIPRIYGKLPKVYTATGEYKIDEVHSLGENVESCLRSGINWDSGEDRKVDEDLAIIELENSVPGVVPPQICGFDPYREDICKDLVLVSTQRRGGDPVFLRIPFALFSQQKEDNSSRKHCMLLGTSLNYDTDPHGCASATEPVNVDLFSLEELIWLNKKNYGAHMFWELQAHDEGAPVCTSEGQLVGLAVTDPCYTLFCEEIEGAFPIVTLSDPETGKIRDDVVELFDTAGLSIADDGVPFIKE